MSRVKDLVTRDVQRMTGNVGAWGDVLTFTSPLGVVAVINGIHTKHHLGVDAELQKLVNTKNAHCSFSEKFLVDAGYPLRDANGIVDLAKHKVSVVDSTGTLCTYMVTENFPDETIGFICCILSDWKAGS